jgi:hypothetical protein
METIRDFEDMLDLLHQHEARYLVIGGLAFIYHAKPRYTKDMDLWIGPAEANLQRANQALAEFGSPTLFEFNNPKQILQMGVAPNRIDLILDAGELDFENAWTRRIEGAYGDAPVNWVDIDTLIEMKSRIQEPRHQDDVRVLKQVKRLRDGPQEELR